MNLVRYYELNFLKYLPFLIKKSSKNIFKHLLIVEVFGMHLITDRKIDTDRRIFSSCLQARGVSIHFLKENILISSDVKTSSMSKLILSIMGAVAEFERSLIRERQQEGIDLAKKRGKYKGRVPIAENKIAKAKELYELGVPLSKISKQTKIGRSTLYRRVVWQKNNHS